MLNEIIFNIQKEAIEASEIKLCKIDEFNHSFEIEISREFLVKCEEVGVYIKYEYKAKIHYLKSTRFANPSFMMDDINESLVNMSIGHSEKLKEPREHDLNKILIQKFKQNKSL